MAKTNTHAQTPPQTCVPVIQMYSVSIVQKGRLERSTASRMVPPPTPVTAATCRKIYNMD